MGERNGLAAAHRFMRAREFQRSRFNAIHLPHREARATAIQPGTLEILDSVGLLQPFLEAAEYIRGARVYGAGLTQLTCHDLKGSRLSI